MKKKTLESKTLSNSVSEEDAMCEYTCIAGAWRLTGMTGGDDFGCNSGRPGVCTNGNQTVVPAYYIGDSELRLIKSKSSVVEIPKNLGEYVYRKGESTVRLVRGKCVGGRYFQPEISLKELTKLVPAAAEFIKYSAKQKMTTLHLLLPAQKVAKHKKVK